MADQVAFDQLLQSLADEPLLAVDTEAASFHRYEDRVYLLQISSRERTAVVDPLAVESLERFAALLADPRIEVIFHDADYDLRLLQRQYGIRAARLFDTRVAAQFLNEPGIGLAALLEKYFGVTLNKKYQRADWSARPLSDEMLAYAATDTRHLPALRDELRGQLEARNRLGWVEEEFALLEGVAWAPVDTTESGYLRLKGAKALKGRELALLRALYDWREGTARRLDRASFRILNNEPLFAMARQPPRTLEELQRVKGIGPETIARRGAEILEAIEQAMAIAERDLPRLPRLPRRRARPGGGRAVRAAQGGAQRASPPGSTWRRAWPARTGRWRRLRGRHRSRWRTSRRFRRFAAGNGRNSGRNCLPPCRSRHRPRQRGDR